MMPDASSRDRGGSGDGERGTGTAATDGEARRPSADDRVGGDVSGSVARDAGHEGEGGSRGPASAASPGDDTIDVEPDDGDGGASVTLLTLVLTGAREFWPDVPQKLVSNECSATRNESEGRTQRDGTKPGGAVDVDGFVEGRQSSPPPPTVARLLVSDEGPTAPRGDAARATDGVDPVDGFAVDTSAVSNSDKSVGVGGGESTLFPGGLPRVGVTDMLDGIDSRAPGPSGTTDDGGVPWWTPDDSDSDGPRPRDDRRATATG